MRRIGLAVLVASSIGCIALGADKGRTHRSITWDKFKASGPELKQIGRIATRHAKDIKSSDWSVGCETLDRDQARFSVYKDYVGELGAKHGRLQSGWAKCEKQKGVYDFAWLDECIHGLNEQGVKPWVCLCYGNPLYKSTVQLGSTLGPIVHSEEALAAWLKYCEATVTRYKDAVHEWEIWNEPFGQGPDYAIMVLATAELIKKIQPNAVILITAITDADRTVVLEALKAAYSDQVPSDELAWDKVNVTVKGVTFKNPVYVELITGKVYELDKSAWKIADGNTALMQLPVWDSPMMHAEREQVELRKDAKP